MVLANSRSLFGEYHQQQNEIASYDDAERQPVVVYKVGTLWVQGQSLEARHIFSSRDCDFSSFD